MEANQEGIRGMQGSTTATHKREKESYNRLFVQRRSYAKREGGSQEREIGTSATKEEEAYLYIRP